jgi:hypothetical protein
VHLRSSSGGYIDWSRAPRGTLHNLAEQEQAPVRLWRSSGAIEPRLEVQYSTHGLTCEWLISGLNGSDAVIPRCSPVLAFLSGMGLARGSPKAVNN